jgi:hypothetical protein
VWCSSPTSTASTSTTSAGPDRGNPTANTPATRGQLSVNVRTLTPCPSTSQAVVPCGPRPTSTTESTPLPHHRRLPPSSRARRVRGTRHRLGARRRGRAAAVAAVDRGLTRRSPAGAGLRLARAGTPSRCCRRLTLEHLYVWGGRVRVRAISAAASPDRGPQGRTGSHPWTPLLLYAGVPRRQAPTRSVARGSDMGTTSSGGFHHGLERLIQGWQCASIGFRRRSFSRFSTPHSVLILSAVRTCHRGVPEESGPHHISCIVSSVALGMKDTPLLEHLAGRSNASRRRADDPPGIDAAVTRPSGQAGRPGPLLRCGASTPASVGAAAPRPAQPSLTTLAQGHERLRPHGGPGPPNPPGPNP